MAKKLYFALQELNQTRLPAIQRLSFLEQFRPHCHYTCQGLRKHFQKKPVILNDKEYKIASLAHTLLNHLYTGYKLVINQLENQEKHDKHHKQNLAIAVHRAINESAHIFLHRYQLYRDVPKNAWIELHTLYLLTEQYNIGQASVEDRENKAVHHTTLSDSYKRILLLSRAQPNMLRQLELEQLFQVLEQWSGKTSIIREEEQCAKESSGEKSKALFSVDCSTSQEPCYTTELKVPPAAPSVLSFSTHELVAELQSQTTPSQLPDSLISHLVSSWGPRIERSHTRYDISDTITLTVGLTNTHFFLAGKRTFQQILLDDIGEQALSQQHSHFKSEDNGDVWNHVAGAVTSGNHLTRLSGIWWCSVNNRRRKSAVYPTLTAKLINSSPGGDCAHIDGEIPAQMQAGEIIGLRSKNNQRWILALIRWIKCKDKSRVIFGIQFLSPLAKPSAISILHKKRGSSDLLRCFHLPASPEAGKPARLITPKVPFQAGNKVRFFDGEHFVQAVLTECISSTGCISEFLYTPAGQHPVSKPGTQAENDQNHSWPDNFDTLWYDL